MRLVVIDDGPDHHRVVMQVHHATSDGIAACEYFGDIWAAYAGLEPRPFSPGRSGDVAPAPTGPVLASGSGTSPLDFARFIPTPLFCRPQAGSSGSRADTAAKAMGNAFLGRRSAECGQFATLAGSIGAATKWILDTGAAAE